MEVIDQAREKMGKTIEALQRELSTLRAGRASSSVLDRITVEYYGTQTPLNQMANISTPEPRVLMISVWDQTAIPAVEKAIQKSDLGINPSNDGKIIRLVFPELTEDRRRELVKTVKKKGEDSKVAIRSIRRDANEQIKKMQKDSEITEDDRKGYEDDIQKLTDDKIKEIDKILADKEKEIMEI